MGSHNLVAPSSPSHSSSTEEGLTVADYGNPDLPGVDRSNMVASAGQTEDRNGSDLSASGSKLPQVWQGCKEELPNLDPLYAFHISGKFI